jgi:hypothetical protein
MSGSGKMLMASQIIIWAAAAVFAQMHEPVYWMAGKLHPCTGDSVQVREEMEFGMDGETISLTVLGVTKTWNDYMDYESERSDFIHGTIEMAGLQCSGAGGAVSMPAQAISTTFRQTVFTNAAKPRISGARRGTGASSSPQSFRPAKIGQQPQPVELPPETAEETKEEGKAVQLEVGTREAGPQLMLPPNNVQTDLEWDFFSIRGSKGNNFALRAGYARTLSDQKSTLGGTVIINTMIMLKKLFFNNALNIYGTRLLAETDNLERKVGASVNMFVVDKAVTGTPLGVSGVFSFSDNWFTGNDNIVSYGAMLQQSYLGDLLTTLVTAGAQYGLPLGQRFAFNTHIIYAINVLTISGGKVVDFDNRHMLQPALSGSFYLSKLFSIDLGLKHTFLVKDYNDLIVTVGAAVLF